MSEEGLRQAIRFVRNGIERIRKSEQAVVRISADPHSSTIDREYARKEHNRIVLDFGYEWQNIEAILDSIREKQGASRG